MKDLKDYINEQLQIDEGLLEFLRGFWNWLSGKTNRAEYEVTSASYDENEKKKYINQYTSDSIQYKDVESIKLIDRIIARSRDNANIQKEGFYNTIEYLKNHPESRKENWGSFIFKTDDLTETCGLVCYTNSGDDKITVIFSEFLSIYNSILNLGDVAKALRKIADEVEIKDKNLIKLFNREEIKLYPVSGEKGLYTL